jgi:hypothetical protein
MTEQSIESKINAARRSRLSDDGGLARLPLEQVSLAQFNSHGDALRRKDPIAFTAIQRNLLVNFIKSQMMPQHDYGNIPGVKEKCLFKAGAERLATLFNLGVQLVQVSAREDYDKGFFAYCYRATVRDRSGFILAECEGLCNSKEKKYRTQDPYSIVNTISKMAQKRAYVGAVILACNASSFFKNAETMQEASLNDNRPTWDIDIEATTVEEPVLRITEAQVKRFWTIATNSGFTKQAVKTWLLTLGITSTREIPQAQYDLLCLQAEQPAFAEFWNCHS